MEDEEIEILLVEDNPGDAELALRALKKQNLANKVTLLTDGAEALDFIFSTGNHSHRNIDNLPRVILLDLLNGLRMPFRKMMPRW